MLLSNSTSFHESSIERNQFSSSQNFIKLSTELGKKNNFKWKKLKSINFIFGAFLDSESISLDSYSWPLG